MFANPCIEKTTDWTNHKKKCFKNVKNHKIQGESTKHSREKWIPGTASLDLPPHSESIHNIQARESQRACDMERTSTQFKEEKPLLRSSKPGVCLSKWVVQFTNYHLDCFASMSEQWTVNTWKCYFEHNLNEHSGNINNVLVRENKNQFPSLMRFWQFNQLDAL